MLPILYLDQRGNPRDLADVKRQVMELGIERYIPSGLRPAPREEPSGKFNRMLPEEFIDLIKSIETPLYSNTRKIIGESTQICMNLTAIITNYLFELLGFPVVGLHSEADKDLDFYLRPTTALFDRRVCFPEYAKNEPCGVEDFIEAKIGDKRYLIDFNFFYDGDPATSRVLIEEIDNWHKFESKYGLYPTQFKGFNGFDIGDPTVRNYLKRKTSGQFAWMVGHPNQKGWCGESELTVQDYIATLSHGALITSGYSPSDLSGSGRIWFPVNFQDRQLLLKLPQPVD